MPSKSKRTASENGQGEPPLEDGLKDRVVQRADGFYWESRKGQTHGPFATLVEAEADMVSGGAVAAGEDVETEDLQEAESELGINEWIDPDTGGPAEDHIPRIEDH
jgi:hypothetical protein